MATDPSISIVMGAYNAQRFLGEAIESLLGQTLADFELIVVDDGSQDSTFDILRRYQAKDARVLPLRIAHGGIVDAANAGIRASRAELIARADADDVYMPDRLRKQYDFLMANPQVVAVGSRMLVIEPYGAPLRVTEHKLQHEEIEAELLTGSGGAMPQPAAMFRKSAVLAVGGYRHDFPYSEDLDLFLRLAETGRLANLPDVLVKYRLHSNSANWQHWQQQVANKPAMMAQAYQRRGRKLPEGMKFSNYWKQPPAERYVTWAWLALKNRDLTGARKHALSALKEAPFSKSSWRAAYCAMRGR